jgi:hypothetical protein
MMDYRPGPNGNMTGAEIDWKLRQHEIDARWERFQADHRCELGSWLVACAL